MAAASAGVTGLPPVTVARFEQVTILIERLADEKTSVFLDAMAAYSDEQRRATQRPLTHSEAVGIASTVGDALGRGDLIALAEEAQQSGLRETGPDPSTRELLLAAGVRTAPAFLDAALRVCALIEIPHDTFHHAVETGALDQAINEHADTLRQLGMAEARTRASAALEHFTTQVGGASPGEAWGLLTGTVWEAIKHAMFQLDASRSRSQTSSDAPTDGPGVSPSA